VSLFALAESIRDSAGIRHKLDLQLAYAGLGSNGPAAPCRVGDDCAALPDGDGFTLFAIEGLLPEFVASEPWFAGYCAVMVNVSDVYAMGGRPTALVDALWCRDHPRGEAIWAGMQAAARAYGVPIVGGHTNARSAHDYLAVAILGRASHLLTSFDAKPDDVLLAAIDLRGEHFKAYPYWNCSTGAPPERLREDLQLLVQVADAGLCASAKDISMGGILGTALMLLESSGVGANVDLEAIPHPPGVALEAWLRTFPSFGFVLSIAPGHVEAVRSLFARRGIACAPIGTCTRERALTIRRGAETALLWDLEAEPFTGGGAYALR
jgi:AIR synthase-related protein